MAFGIKSCRTLFQEHKLSYSYKVSIVALYIRGKYFNFQLRVFTFVVAQCK